jgi:uncharacterized protein (TIGR00730 family)
MGKRCTVYAASSPHSAPEFLDTARALGAALANDGWTLVYGGGAGGEVIGIIPKFMADLEWGHGGITRLELVEDMRERKHRLLQGSDAVVALPGGCGTLEELFEAITLKRLGLYRAPIVLLDTRDYWAPLVRFMDERVIGEGFMNPEHAGMWTRVERVADVLPTIARTPLWREDARDYAIVRPR